MTQGIKGPAVCTIEGCTNSPTYSRGWCKSHYGRWQRWDDPEYFPPPRGRSICKYDGCTNVVASHGWCSTHALRIRVHGDVNHVTVRTRSMCTITGCGEPAKSGGYCKDHYYRDFWYGDPLAEKPSEVRARGCTYLDETGVRCGEEWHSNGYCYRHYRKFVYNPSVRARRAKASIEREAERLLNPGPTWDERFEASIDRMGPWPRWLTGVGRCWQWTATTSQGYGVQSLNGKHVRAHRVSYEKWIGPLDDGMVTDHLCRNPACQRHLESVTRAENTRRGNDCAKCMFFQSCPDCGSDLRGIGRIPPERPPTVGYTAVLLAPTLEETFWLNVDRDGPWSELLGSNCWDWTSRAKSQRYSSFNFRKVRHAPHRLAVELDGRTIPTGYVGDHLCLRKCCVRFDHIEVVTNGENVKRGKSCVRCVLLKSCPGCGLDIAGCVNANRWQDESAV